MEVRFRRVVSFVVAVAVLGGGCAEGADEHQPDVVIDAISDVIAG
jgi:hypothetical protein